MNIHPTLSCFLASCIAAAAPVTARAGAVMTFSHEVTIPDVTGGDFDHLAVDLQADRLYITAEKHQSVEAFRLSDGAHLGSMPGFENPHSIHFIKGRSELFVADGGASEVKVVDTKTMQVVAHIPTRPGPDAALYDARRRRLYVGCGGAVEHAQDSSIVVIDVDTRREVARLSVPTNNIESMAIDEARDRLFVNMRDKQAIGVFDLTNGQMTHTWKPEGLNLNTPMEIDPHTHRLFVVGRKPGELFVIDFENGKTMSRTAAVDIADDMSWDARNQRIYVSGAGGLSVFRRLDVDHFKEVQRLDTKGGKTSAYVPSLQQFYVVHTAAGSVGAALDIYKVGGNRQ